MGISTLHTTRITLNKLNTRPDCKGMNFRAIPENWPKVKFSKILQNSTPSSYCYASFTSVFVGEFPIKIDRLGHLIQPFVRIAVQPKNHNPENQNELMGVPLKTDFNLLLTNPRPRVRRDRQSDYVMTGYVIIDYII